MIGWFDSENNITFMLVPHMKNMIGGNRGDALGESSVIQCPHEVHHQSLSHMGEGHKLSLA
jgi:hypothetical protein